MPKSNYLVITIVLIVTLAVTNSSFAAFVRIEESPMIDSVRAAKNQKLSENRYVLYVNEQSRSIKVEFDGIPIMIADVDSNCAAWGESCPELVVPADASWELTLRGISDYVIVRERLVDLEHDAICEVGYLDEWEISTQDQELLRRNGICLEVDTAALEVSARISDPFPDCPFWCVCGPEGKCWEKGNTCFTCAAAPSPGIVNMARMKTLVSDIVQMFIKRNHLQ